jgi:hypothetical protein
MSLNSLQDDMSRRAASMAAMAKRATNPQDIQAIQKSLVAGVQNGSIQPYVGIPLIQELTKKLTEAQAQMAQTMAGAGMQQGAQGQQAPQPPIAQQVMQQAAQTDQSQGLEALPSNLPQEYAGGGIIAFEEGGEVERYQNTGLVSPTPAGRFFSGLKQDVATSNEAAELRNKLQMQYGPKSALPGLFMTQTDEERQAAKDIVGRLGTMTLPQLQALYAQGPSALPPITPPAVKPYDPATATLRSQYTNEPYPTAGAAAPAAAAAAAAPGIGGGGFKTPTLPTMKEIPVPKLTDYNTLIGDLPAKAKAASEAAVKSAQTELEGFDKPGFEAREEKFGKREATQEKDSAMRRALDVMSLGFGIAGSKERTLAGALGNEGRQGIQTLIQGEAANRAAKDRLEDARDNFEQQKVAAKKGNYQAAQAAGKEASRDLQAATQLTMTGAHYGNTESLQRYQTQQQGEFQKTSLGQSGALGLAGLNLQQQQLAQTGAFQNKQLAAMEKRYAAMDAASKARMAQVRAGAMGKFMETQGGQLNTQLAKEYGPNWRTSTDPRSLQAQMLFKQAQNAYVMDALGQYDDRPSAKDSSEL